MLKNCWVNGCARMGWSLGPAAWIAGELKARWNQALARVAEVESRIVAHGAACPAPAIDAAALAILGANLKTVWTAPTTDARSKKHIARTLIHEVVADIDDAASEIVIVVHWSGGLLGKTTHCKQYAC